VATGCGGSKTTDTVTVTVTETVGSASGSGAGSCREAVTPLLQAAQDLSARLKVGVLYNDYVKAVGDLSVADSRIGQTSANCAGVLRNSEE
jgi:hypothetical protein